MKNKFKHLLTICIIAVIGIILVHTTELRDVYAVPPVPMNGDQLLCWGPYSVPEGWCCPYQLNYSKETICNSYIPPGYWPIGSGFRAMNAESGYYVAEGTGSEFCGGPSFPSYYAWNTEDGPHHTYVFWNFKGCIDLNGGNNPYWDSSVWAFMPSNTSATSTEHASYTINHNQYWYTNVPWNQTLYNNQWKMLDYNSGWVHQLRLHDTTGETNMTRKVHYDDAMIMYYYLQ
ncbi:hypothetical protein A3H80_04990 [Candidatus Roizmanbacteria bacterium RIFCSPLOWO2_02_FULL_37_19]|uniref:Uncharacterized protein n=1 Tax=Candidatus Roizmanbacteria bacterium RIFCSPHIGHO2_02_FULL_37_24 TaxID=1802037 RepID=A0A1F7H039_9BACT|nr:MAG: hypothetical protein A2862_04385 [Candidatus Roizmanbacteria bacterium RIFCSPHIGHO2_01_FULL_38_41]OGK24156.1 MAG: hypothetical protein A3C24_02695 [Candidatus Roizmanbacteria bacterium RIFCSPHIGHO2_02_FULL_37_24]OGK32047.1 MAG: hypothetical protein A3E10_04895 [Candidatus Roizmanbacteria bacterium RIFCSPHIGHO2_12_FULL_37_23]OGK43986.1 MAG: hypothetical protein A2956_04860 [Candidatus Roizmanbacteria bacterium RIFCSPLOWO2_01_FULL_37_57]OGK55078.1 MAG: hypothetical protein A3H80_04990 [Ca